MVNRNDLMDVDLAVMAFMRDHPDAPMAKIIRAAVEAAEPPIRADERMRGRGIAEEFFLTEAAHARQTLEADLRAKVEALPQRGLAMPYGYPGEGYELVYRSDVLALFDGGQR